MREKKTVLVITFATTNAAMAMEQCCRNAGMQGRLIPLPAELSAGCGLCWKTNVMDQEVWRAFLDQEHILYDTMREMRLL